MKLARCISLGLAALLFASLGHAASWRSPVGGDSPAGRPVIDMPLPPPPKLPEGFFDTPPDCKTVGFSTPTRKGLAAEKSLLNADTVGWLYIPGTDVDREVLQNPANSDNNYYLNVSFSRQPDKNGTFCADLRCRFEGELSRNTTIYGHSWDDDPDGELFAQLKRYRNPEFAREHPYIYFSTTGEDMAWEVIAVFESTVEIPYNVPNLGEDEFFDMMDLVYDSSLYCYNSAVGPRDKLLTLSTCVFSVRGHEMLPDESPYRFAVMARLVSPGEPLLEEADFVINPAPLSPDEATRRLRDGAIRAYEFGVAL